MIVNILSQFGAGLLAVLVFNVFSFKKYFTDPKIRADIYRKVFWDAFFRDSKIIWIWSVIMILLLSITINLMPATADIIKEQLKWDLANSVESFFMLGLSMSWGLYGRK